MTLTNEAAERQALNAYMAAPESQADETWEAYLSAVAAREAAVLAAERREMILRIERSLFARGWTLDQDEGPQADVRAVIDEEAARI